MTKEELKELCLKEIDNNKEEIIALGENIYKTPELGYKEFETTKTIENGFKSLGLETKSGIAYTGCRAQIGENDGPTVAVVGELDCVNCATHPDSIANGNIHACGHNVQLANIFGAALGLTKSGIMKDLAGKVDFLAVPAEECVDYNYRDQLIEDKKIKYYGGKQELIYRDELKDDDLFLQCHMMDVPDGKSSLVNTDCDGFITKQVTFIGKGSHAGFAPEEGINALNMAELALNNIHAQRETFHDEDMVRVSTIITKGGDLVNIVPSEVKMQIMVRAFTIDAILDASKKVDRALKASALALGGKVTIKNQMGYMPMNTDRNLSKLYEENMVNYGNIEPDDFIESYKTAGSTDLGDLSQMKPCMHIWAAGVKGGLHTEDYRIADKEQAYILPAKMLALSVIDLLFDEAKTAKDIMNKFKPSFNRDTYLDFMNEHTNVNHFDGSTL